MDPTQTLSYRRWRKNIAGKGYSGDPVRTETPLSAPSKALASVWEKVDRGDMENQKPIMFAFNRRADEMQAEKLIKNLEREYRKSAYFRKEKVAELKRRIQNGQYSVPGRAVVEMWFKKPPESESR